MLGSHLQLADAAHGARQKDHKDAAGRCRLGLSIQQPGVSQVGGHKGR